MGYRNEIRRAQYCKSESVLVFIIRTVYPKIAKGYIELFSSRKFIMITELQIRFCVLGK